VELLDWRAEIEWLQQPSEIPTGYDPDLWSADTWILHAMYEGEVLDEDSSSQEWLNIQTHGGDGALAGEPSALGESSPGFRLTYPGGGLGKALGHSEGDARVLWSDYLERTGAPGRSVRMPPCFRWFKEFSFRAHMRPPSEGSTDFESFQAMIEVLVAASPQGASTRVLWYFWDWVATHQHHDFESEVWIGELSDLVPMYLNDGRQFTPQNIWPDDRTWLVCIDYDLMATHVRGSESLISAIRRHPVLETTQYKRVRRADSDRTQD